MCLALAALVLAGCGQSSDAGRRERTRLTASLRAELRNETDPVMGDPMMSVPLENCMLGRAQSMPVGQLRQFDRRHPGHRALVKWMGLIRSCLASGHGADEARQSMIDSAAMSLEHAPAAVQQCVPRAIEEIPNRTVAALFSTYGRRSAKLQWAARIHHTVVTYCFRQPDVRRTYRQIVVVMLKRVVARHPLPPATRRCLLRGAAQITYPQARQVFEQQAAPVLRSLATRCGLGVPVA